MVLFPNMKTRRIYVSLIVLAVLIISIAKLSSYITLANTIYNLFGKESELNAKSQVLSESDQVETASKKLRKDRILVSIATEPEKYDLFIINPDDSREQITNTSYSEMNAQFSPDGKAIAYAANPDPGDYDVLRTEIKTGDTTNLTASTANDWDPTFSPDGNKIVFMSNRADAKSGNGDIYIIDPFGNDPINLTKNRPSTEEWGPTYSPDSEKVYFVSGTEEKSEIYSANADGSLQTKLTDNSTDDWYPKVNNAGDKLTYVCKNPENTSGPDQICIMDLESKTSQAIPNQPTNGDNDDPVFSSDGNAVYFVHLEDEKTYNLYSINVDGTSPEKITEGDQTVLSPAVIPVTN